MQSKNATHHQSKNSLTLYLHEISLIPLLSREEEFELARQIQTGSHEALQRLVESNLRFVVKVAKRYSFAYSLHDLINDGNLGLMEAAKRFDPERGVRFISYAIWWIRQAIFSALSNFAYPLKIPAKINQSLLRIRASMPPSEHSMEKGTGATLEEMGKELGFSAKQMTIAVQATTRHVSLDQPLHSGSQHSVGELIEQSSVRSAERVVVDDSVRRSLREVLGGLKEKEQKVLKLRFGIDRDTGLTLKEIGSLLGVTRERIRQIESQALLRLRSNPNVTAMK